MRKVVISGGSGLLGQRLTDLLIEKGYEVVILSRSDKKSRKSKVSYREWDPDKGEFPDGLIEETDYVVNLAGANIAGKRWTKSYKKVLLESRVNSTRLIVEQLNTKQHKVKAMLSVSGSGYYGYDRNDILHEEAAPADNFLARLCVAWEAEAQKLEAMQTRLVIFRIGIALSTQGGALAELAKPVKLGAGAPLGSGKQFVPWIHIDDLCNMMIFALERDNVSGVYNAAGPEPATNRTLTKAIAMELGKRLFLPPVPGFVLRVMLGEMAGSLTGSVKAPPDKILQKGFSFEHPELHKAIHDLYVNGK